MPKTKKPKSMYGGQVEKEQCSKCFRIGFGEEVQIRSQTYFEPAEYDFVCHVCLRRQDRYEREEQSYAKARFEQQYDL